MSRQNFIERAVPAVVNDMGEIRHTRANSIIFNNGWVASIVPNTGITVFDSNGEWNTIYDSNKKYSVAICDYNGYFDWDILNDHGGVRGHIYCDNEDEICAALSIIEKL